MRSLLTFLLLCFCLTAVMAQTPAQKKAITTARKAATTAKKTATTARKAVTTRPRPATVVTTTTETTASTLTFPSTEPENAAALDAVKKQQMYDELHGVKAQSATPDTGKKGRKGSRGTDAMDNRANQRAASAGSSSEANTFIGVRVGGNYTTYLDKLVIANGLGGFLDVTPKPYYGFHAGVVFQFGNGGIAFQPEINFNQDYIKTAGLLGIGEQTVSASSLVVPLLAKFQFGQQGNARFFANVGPYGTYSLAAKVANSETVIGYGGALGLGVGIPMGSGKFTVEARGYYALGSTASGSKFGDVLGKPVTGQLSVGYLFPLGSR